MRGLRMLLCAALTLAPVIADAQTLRQETEAGRFRDRSPTHPYAGHVADAARRFGIPETWIWSVMRIESGGNRNALSPAGAMGLMQLMPATWAALRAQLKLGNDPFDVGDNILAGAAYLRAMHDRYGDSAAMLAAYNAGPGRYDEYRSRGRPLPLETRAYLARVGPMIGNAGDVRLAEVRSPADPVAWRRAALFVRTAGTNSANVTSQPERRGDDLPAATRASSNPLFVRRVSAVRSQ